MLDTTSVKTTITSLITIFNTYYPIVEKKVISIVENPIFYVTAGFFVFFYVNYLIVKHMGQAGLYVAIFLIMASLVVLGTYTMGHFLIPGM